MTNECTFYLIGQVDFGNKARIQKLQKDLKMLEQVLDTVDEEKARKVNINVPNKRQFVEPERSAIREDDRDQVLKRYPDDLQYQLCPDTVDRLECFESYMVLWLHMVGERQGKRTYIGKRSSDDNAAERRPNIRLVDVLLGKAPDLANDSRKQSEDNKVADSLLLDANQIRQMCTSSKNKDFCYRLGLTRAMGTFFNSLREKSSSSSALVENNLRKRGLCDGVADTLSCFYHYLGMYAKMHPSSSGPNQFVGRRMAYKK